MLDEDDQKMFDELVDEERYSQVEDFAERGLAYGVQLALSVLRHEPRAHRDALRYLYRFGNWQDFQLSAADRTLLEQWEEDGRE